MSDKDLRQNIIDQLEFEPGVDAAHIGIAVERGIVTLTGHVTTYGQKILVEKAVQHIKGVHGIAEEIEVRPFGDPLNSDENIAKRALNIINWNTFVPNDAVQVKVQKGWVTLTGKLEWQFQRTEAEDAVRRLAGVIGVTNSIELTPQVSVTDVKKRIEDALKRAAAVEAAAIHVNVLDSGKIKLEGKVHNWAERNAAERAAWSAPGVRAVEDHLMFS